MSLDHLAVSVELLADHPELVDAVGRMRWREWGRPPEPDDPSFWINMTRMEAGRDKIPVTWVAIDAEGRAVGAVGLGEFDIDEVQDRSPWVMGTIVDDAWRRQGVGQRLMQALERWAGDHGYRTVWVATERASDFYRSCGWRFTETVQKRSGDIASILVREFDGE